MLKFYFLIILIIFPACTKTYSAPNIVDLYQRSAQYHGPDRNPVIVIPGILGSKLIDQSDGLRVWGAWDGVYANPNKAEDVRKIALPLDTDSSIVDLTDDVKSDGALDSVKLSLFGIPIELKTYFNLLVTIGAGGYTDKMLIADGELDYGKDHYTCFQFDYDWRKSNVYNAARLYKFIKEKRAYIQGEYEKRFGLKNYDVKFDLIAHSMGGLLTRYMLRYGEQPLENAELNWSGAEHVDKVVLIGAPNAGSIYSLNNLLNGQKLAPLIPHYHAAILGTLPAVYELLPRERHQSVFTELGGKKQNLDIYDPQLWIDNKWGLVDPEQDFVLKWLLPEVDSAAERYKIASKRLGDSLQYAKRFHQAMDSLSKFPDNISVTAVLGDAIPTYQAINVLENGKTKYASIMPGDGLVTRASVLLDERVGNEWSPFLQSPIKYNNTLFLFTDHVGLTTSPIFSDNILHILLES